MFLNRSSGFSSCSTHCSKLTHTDLKPENVLFATTDWYAVSPGTAARESAAVAAASRGKVTASQQIRRMRDTRKFAAPIGRAPFLLDF